MNLKSVGEFGLIEHLSRDLKTRAGLKIGIGDDAAVLKSLSSPVATTDALVENIHFRRDWTTPRALGRKAMAVNLSDIAAMGAKPIAALVSLALDPREPIEFLDEIYAGFEEMAAQFDFSIAGGDTTQTRGPMVISITIIGNAQRPILRSGAQIGDTLLVTGTLGDSAAGLQWLLNPKTPMDEAARETILSRHHEPTPRILEIEAALASENLAVHAALDLSDGLAGDATHLAKQSKINLEIETELLPISLACRAAALALETEAVEWALSGGEDYELLLAVAPERAENVIQNIKNATGTPVCAIGKCGAGEGIVVLRENGIERAAPSGFRHF